MILNRSHIKSAKGSYKYPTEEQFKCIGLTGPFLNWETELLGKEFSNKELYGFIGNNNPVKPKKKRKPRKSRQPRIKKTKPTSKRKPRVDHKKEYLDRLWKDKRKVILSRDNYTCVRCNTSNTMLHIHHLLYIRGKSIWAVPDYYLVTLCESCHKIEHSQQYSPPSKHY